MKRFAVSTLTYALCVIVIAELSSALIVQSHSNQIQTYNEEDTGRESCGYCGVELYVTNQ